MTTVEIIPAPDGVAPTEFVSGDYELAGFPHHEVVIEELRRSAGQTQPWHLALLGAISKWDLVHERTPDRHWRYVIGGEALDWLTLAQRLCLEIPDVVPSDELEALLFRGQLPQRIGPEKFRELIGPYRYTAVLNYHYGVVVEEAIQLVVEDALRKSRIARCYQDTDEVVDDAYRHLYGEPQPVLAGQFLAETDGIWGSDLENLSLAAWQEFTYWLFKKRVRKWHPARVASDTRRGLERLRELNVISDNLPSAGFEGPAHEAPALSGAWTP